MPLHDSRLRDIPELRPEPILRNLRGTTHRLRRWLVKPGYAISVDPAKSVPFVVFEFVPGQRPFGGIQNTLLSDATVRINDLLATTQKAPKDYSAIRNTRRPWYPPIAGALKLRGQIVE